MRAPKLLRALRRDDRGVAAIEAALVSSLLAVSVMNVAEVARYAFISTQVEAVTQGAAQAAVVTCDTNHTPVMQNCPELTDAINTALHGSSLGDQVSLKEGSLTEGWFCVDSANKLQPADGPDDTCTVAKPGLYLKLSSTYAYQPLFPGLTVVQAFSDTIGHTAWMRTL